MVPGKTSQIKAPPAQIGINTFENEKVEQIECRGEWWFGQYLKETYLLTKDFRLAKDQTCCKEINVWDGRHLWYVMLGRHLEVFLAKQFWASCCLTRTSTRHSVASPVVVTGYCGTVVLWRTVVFSGYYGILWYSQGIWNPGSVSYPHFPSEAPVWPHIAAAHFWNIQRQA